jgi:beta-glucosidase
LIFSAGTGFATKEIDRLDVPELRMTDGPVGARWDKSTAFPVSIAMAATWNPSLVKGIGSAIGRETKGHARHVILGPCVNIARLPMAEEILKASAKILSSLLKWLCRISKCSK